MMRNVVMGMVLLGTMGCLSGWARQSTFDKTAFYLVLKSGSTAALDAEIDKVNASALLEKEAYTGTLLMKKAELESKAKEKLKYFKMGRTKLEAAINKHTENAEYRFLRLIIQEHAPKVVKYRTQIEEDNDMIRNNFKSLPPSLQEQITDYSKTSKALKGI